MPWKSPTKNCRNRHCRSNGATLAKGLYYRAWLTAHGIAVHQGATLTQIEGEQRVSGIRWGEHSLECDAVGFAHALRSETQLADLLGCAFAWNALNRAWLPQRDSAGRSSVSGVYLAGDGAGIMGADAAQMAGERAALAVLEDSGIAIDHRRPAALEQKLAGIQRFRQGLETAFPFPEQWAAQAPDTLMVCRCEEVSAGEIRAVVDEGHWEINRVKAHCRVGMGANCVYPLIGHSEYRWQFLGTEVDPTAVKAAKAIVQSNGLNKAISLRLQPDPKKILLDVLDSAERFDLSMCNPPFHASIDEATRGSERKWRALGKADPKRKLPVLNFGGQSAELWCEGGEARFVTQLIAESAHFAHKVLWFSCLVSKASNLPAIETALKKAGVLESQVVEMSQGQKQSRFVAWTFQTKNEQQIWRQRWVRD